MTLEERRVTDALTTYAEAVTMSPNELDRLQEDLRRRIEQPRRRPRRLALVAAVVVLVLALTAAGAWWLRRPAPPVPATPQPAGSLEGLWKFTDPVTKVVFVVRDDHTVRVYPSAQELVRHLTGDSARVSTDGSQVVVDATDPQGRTCRSTRPILRQTDGFLAQGRETRSGPGCSPAPPYESVITRLSPVSPATRDLPTSSAPPVLVTDPVQLDGIWLLQGTGLVLAVDERTGPAAYLLDRKGQTDTAPDAQGPVAVPADGQIVLSGGVCGDGTLGHAEIRGQADDKTLTTTVVADPCSWFEGRPTLVWVKVLDP